MISLAEFLESAFARTSVMEMYPMVEDARRALGFSAPENNAAVMKQVTYVTKEFRKQQEKLHAPVIQVAEAGQAQQLLEYLKERREAWDTYPSDEDNALYMCLRDVWMNNLINLVQTWINYDGEIDVQGEER